MKDRMAEWVKALVERENWCKGEMLWGWIRAGDMTWGETGLKFFFSIGCKICIVILVMYVTNVCKICFNIIVTNDGAKL